MTICIAEKLDLTCQLKKGEQIVDIWHSATLTPSSIHTIHENTNRITESAMSELSCLCGKTATVIFE